MPHFLPSPALCRPPSTSHLNLFMAGDAWHSGTHSPVSEELFGATTDRSWRALKEDSGGPGTRFSGLYSSTLFMLTEAKGQSQIQSLLLSSSTKAQVLASFPHSLILENTLCMSQCSLCTGPVWVPVPFMLFLLLGGCCPVKPCPTQGSPALSPAQCHQGV